MGFLEVFFIVPTYTRFEVFNHREGIKQVYHSEFKFIERTNSQFKCSTQVFTVTDILYALQYTILCLLKLVYVKNSGDIN